MVFIYFPENNSLKKWNSALNFSGLSRLTTYFGWKTIKIQQKRQFSASVQSTILPVFCGLSSTIFSILSETQICSLSKLMFLRLKTNTKDRTCKIRLLEWLRNCPESSDLSLVLRLLEKKQQVLRFIWLSRKANGNSSANFPSAIRKYQMWVLESFWEWVWGIWKTSTLPATTYATQA